jgi:hypothetical protein
MIPTRLLAALVLLFGTIHAQEFGTVTITKSKANITIGKDTVGTAAKGAVYQVTAIQGDWYWVEPAGGWVHRADVKFRPKSASPGTDRGDAPPDPRAGKEGQTAPMEGSQESPRPAQPTDGGPEGSTNAGGDQIPPPEGRRPMHPGDRGDRKGRPMPSAEGNMRGQQGPPPGQGDGQQFGPPDGQRPSMPPEGRRPMHPGDRGDRKGRPMPPQEEHGHGQPGTPGQ